jgi:hypothetical protein
MVAKKKKRESAEGANKGWTTYIGLFLNYVEYTPQISYGTKSGVH